MTKSKKKESKQRASYPDEYKAQIVELAQQEGNSPYGVAREMGLAPSMVAQWVRRAGGARDGATTSLSTAERTELMSLRREVKCLRQEREILAKATALFAKRGTT